MNGKIHLDHQVIWVKDSLSPRWMEWVYMDATINAARKDSVFIKFDSKISRLDITKLFTQMENFGRDNHDRQNVKGSVSADVQFSSAWSVDLNIDEGKVRSTCDITIDNGSWTILLNTGIVQISQGAGSESFRFSTLRIRSLFLTSDLYSKHGH